MKRRVIVAVLIALLICVGFAFRPVANLVELRRLRVFTPVGPHPGWLAEARFLQDIARVLQLSRAEFPAGLRVNGRYENHLNWDAVKIFRYAGPTLDEPTRAAARAEMSRMLRWCLAESYRPDGSFKLSELDDTVGDAMQFGVYFLRDIGFFRKKDRFWTDQEFPEAEAVRTRIKKRIESIGLDNPRLRSAYDRL